MTHVSVTVDDGHLAALDGVVQGLRARGMQVDQVLDGLGIITGSVPSGTLGALTGVAGVASVDEQLGVQLPAPESPVQ
ncbi:ketohydroxyglutarate aldolase [Blastococcus sp. TF02A-35]|uniref:ketohydroxyglutarate aldolase n=1 Tax=Blastococcus sp. TF02A-35 TaxID=2559612 RepID=UPI0010748043|nr:ketohydroxyglutarate aldolase [Blastococcus sp. TF02A_35]TFV47460.1 ketohydroxyglutarate aldolase [Blastococcus sp. TF02A_35]